LENQHIFCIKESGNIQLAFGCREGQFVVLQNIFLFKSFERDYVGPESMNDGAKSKTVPERSGHVNHFYVPVAFTSTLAPFLECFNATFSCHRLIEGITDI
jgi:hypothetical protein